MDIDKALKAAGVNKGKVDQVRGELQPQLSDETVSSPEIEGGTQMDMDKPLLKSFGSSKGNVTNLVRPLERVLSVAPQPSDDIDEVSDEVEFSQNFHDIPVLLSDRVSHGDTFSSGIIRAWRSSENPDSLGLGSQRMFFGACSDSCNNDCNDSRVHSCSLACSVLLSSGFSLFYFLFPVAPVIGTNATGISCSTSKSSFFFLTRVSV